MDYLDIGFSNIRLPNNENSYIYRYDSRINTFPEEVYLHEFLHTMERISRENGLEYPLLHDYEKYGYESHALEGLKKWYTDFMTSKINDSGTYIGLDPKVYALKPVHAKNFTNSITVAFDENPNNFIEEIQSVIKALMQGISHIKEQTEKVTTQ